MFEVCMSMLKDLVPIIPAFICLILVFNLISDLLFRNGG